MALRKRKAARRKTTARRQTKRWSARVTRESDALDLEGGIFNKRSAKAIAQSLKRSAEHSHRRKSALLRSAKSIRTFYINCADKNLPASRRRTLQAAKGEPRKLFA